MAKQTQIGLFRHIFFHSFLSQNLNISLSLNYNASVHILVILPFGIIVSLQSVYSIWWIGKSERGDYVYLKWLPIIIKL